MASVGQTSQTDPLLPASTEPPPSPEPAAAPVPSTNRPKHVICDFCQCKLAMDGGVLETGQRARRLAAGEDKTEALNAEIESLRSQLGTAREQLADRERMLREDAEASGSRRRF